MSDPRNVAHDKRVTQEKKHQSATVTLDDAPAVQPGKKRAAAKIKSEPVDAIADRDDTAAGRNAAAGGTAETPAAALEGSLVVLSKLKELEFHSRAHLERLAELTMTVEDELNQGAMARPLGDVYSAQNQVQTRLTALIEAYKTVCDRLQGQ